MAVHRPTDDRPEETGGSGEHRRRGIGRDDEPVTLDPAHDALGDGSALRTLIVDEMLAVAAGFDSFSRASPGVSVSGGSAHATRIPCGLSSARNVSARPRSANFAGAYAEYP